MKILIVKYLPSGEKSNTLQLLEHFNLSSKTHTIEEIDLLKNPPPFFNETSMEAYKLRNWGGQKLDPTHAQAIAPMDRLSAQFKNADLIVMAFPMHNFSVPGIVKTYFDAIMQKEQVFKSEGNKSIGLMSNKKFLALYTSMGGYKGEYGYLDNVKTLLKIELDFMGFKDYEFVQVTTGNEATMDVYLSGAKVTISNILTKWKV